MQRLGAQNASRLCQAPPPLCRRLSQVVGERGRCTAPSPRATVGRGSSRLIDSCLPGAPLRPPSPGDVVGTRNRSAFAILASRGMKARRKSQSDVKKLANSDRNRGGGREESHRLGDYWKRAGGARSPAVTAASRPAGFSLDARPRLALPENPRREREGGRESSRPQSPPNSLSAHSGQ
jgi:hypothetical protein